MRGRSMRGPVLAKPLTPRSEADFAVFLGCPDSMLVVPGSIGAVETLRGPLPSGMLAVQAHSSPASRVPLRHESQRNHRLHGRSRAAALAMVNQPRDPRESRTLSRLKCLTLELATISFLQALHC